MNPIDSTGALISRIRELTNTQPNPSIADVVASPEPTGLERLSASEFTAKYEVAVLVNTLRANADMALALIQMFDKPSSPLE